jgi:hypothetical protein
LPFVFLSSFRCPAWRFVALRQVALGACVGSMREWSIPYRDYTQPADRVRTAPSQPWSLSTVPERAAAQPHCAAGGPRGTLAATMSRASRNPGKVNAKNDRCRCLRLFERHVLSTIQLLDLARRPRRNSDAHTRCLAGERLRWQTRSRCLIPARHARLTDLASAPIGLVAADCDLREAQSAAAGFTLSCGTYECTIHHLNL